MQDVFTAGRFLDQAGRAVQDVVSRGKVPIVVGGTSMYTQWLVQGKPDAPKYVRFQHVLSSY
jgi:tRNA dimethylallyltransferase